MKRSVLRRLPTIQQATYLDVYASCLSRGLMLYRTMAEALGRPNVKGEAALIDAQKVLAASWTQKVTTEAPRSSGAGASQAVVLLTCAGSGRYENRVCFEADRFHIQALKNYNPRGEHKAKGVSNNHALAHTVLTAAKALGITDPLPLESIVRREVVNAHSKAVCYLSFPSGTEYRDGTYERVIGPRDPDFYALLGTPNLLSSAWLVAQHGWHHSYRGAIVNEIYVACRVNADKKVELPAEASHPRQRRMMAMAMAPAEGKGIAPAAPESKGDEADLPGPASGKGSLFLVDVIEARYRRDVTLDMCAKNRFQAFFDLMCEPLLNQYFTFVPGGPDTYK
jgi:hypothetical protein